MLHCKKFLLEKFDDKTTRTILNLGGGKIDEDFIETSKKHMLVNVDQSYKYNHNDPAELIKFHIDVLNNDRAPDDEYTWFIKSDIFDFVDSYPLKFDYIIANRIFEHMFYDSGEIGRLLSACHYLLNDGGIMYIIVPNHEILAQLLINNPMSEINHTIVNNKLLVLNTEFCNTRVDPHGSIWTPELAKYYIESEGVWKINFIYNEVEWDDRPCYMMIEILKNSID
jgi:SAM-dependent methyltransferase